MHGFDLEQPQPKMLDGSYAGDVGFDPLGFSEVRTIFRGCRCENEELSVCLNLDLMVTMRL